MNDLFRFLLLRPAEPTEPKDVNSLAASFAPQGAPPADLKESARAYVANKGVVVSLDELTFHVVARAVTDAVGTGSMSVEELVVLVKTQTTRKPADLIGDASFQKDEERVADSLVAMKALSNSLSGDAPGLAKLAQGYDAIRRAGEGKEDSIALRVLSISEYRPKPKLVKEAEKPQMPVPPEPAKPSEADMRRLAQLEEAIQHLKNIPAGGFHVEVQTAKQPARSQKAAAAAKNARAKPPVSMAAKTSVAQPWVLAKNTVASLPESVRATVKSSGLNLDTQAVPMILNHLDEQKTQLMQKFETIGAVRAKTIVQLGNFFGAVASSDYVGSPGTAMPAGHGNIKPVGVGDLLLVKEHVLRYEGGDLAHVENVLKSEHLSRDTRRLERTETTFVEEKETTKEDQRDTQTTDRFSLKRETSDTIQTEFSLKAGLSVDAKYGPMVEVKANADFATSTATQSATKQASEFSKDVVARSASKLVERVLERRSTTTISEFEEKYSHGFDNTNGAAHISGYYQWIDKVMQAQVYNYGKRLLFDVTVPEPGTNFILTQTKAADQGQNLEEPIPFTHSADQVNEGNYRTLAARYGATGLEPPPPPVKTVTKSFDATVAQGPHESSKSDTLAIDDGYRAQYALFQRSALGWVTEGLRWQFLIGSNWIDAFSGTGYVDMSGEVGSVPLAYEAYQVEVLAATVEVFCERTERAMEAWQIKMHAAILQAYQAKKQAYDQALAQAKAAAGVVIAGRNPAFNSRLIADELRKQCLTLISAQQFDAFGALELSPQGFAQPNLTRTEAQMPYVRFFEQAFEWEHITYFYYPYFWGWKPAWHKHMLLDDVDPQFADFLRAGAARVVFPVRPGFEAAVIHYLETGEIWNGGPPPDISSSLYVPIVKEIQEATGAPGSEVPVDDPWLVHLPTTLVRLRPNNDLPEWKKDNEENWVPVN